MSVRSSRLDLTQGSIRGHLIRFALPMLIQNVIQNLYGVADSIWLGQLVGSHALGAVNVSNPVVFLVNAFIMGIFTATTVLIAQNTGAQDEEGVKKTINTSLSFGIVCALALTIVGSLLCTPILQLIQTPDTILDAAVDYLRIIFFGLLFTFGFNSIGAVLRGMGDSRTPMWVVLGAAVANIILDPIFIADWGLGMGIAGAALATILSQALSFFVAIIYLRRKQHAMSFRVRELRIDKEIFRKILKIGMPTSIQQMLLSVSFLFVSSLINGFGEILVTANGIIMRLDGFAIMPSFAISAAVSSVAGQNLGARNPARALEALRWGRILGVGISVVMAALLFIFAEPLCGMFINAGDSLRAVIVDRSAECMRIIAITYVLFAFMQSNNGFMSGSGATLLLMILTIASQILRVAAAYLMVYGAGMDYQAIYYAQYIPSVVTCVATTIYIASGRWRRIRLTGPAPEPERTEAA